MKMLIDFFPGIFFVVALFTFDIYIATKVIMIAMTVQIMLMKIFKYSVNAIQWLAFVVILGFGAATLLLHDPVFIQWKPTIINWVFAIALLMGPRFFKRNFIQSMMAEQFELPPEIWRKVNLAWALFFTSIGFLNIWVAYTFSEKVWGLFKVFGIMGLMLVFVLAQAVYLGRHIQLEETDKPADAP